MTTTITDHLITVSSIDSQGKWRFNVHRSGTQISIEVADDGEYSAEELYFDVNRKELSAIRDAINEVLKELT